MINTPNPNQQASDETAPKKKRQILWSVLKKVISVALWIYRILKFFSDEG